MTGRLESSPLSWTRESTAWFMSSKKASFIELIGLEFIVTRVKVELALGTETV